MNGNCGEYCRQDSLERNWQEAEALCLELGIDYYIKDDLRKEMEKP